MYIDHYIHFCLNYYKNKYPARYSFISNRAKGSRLSTCGALKWYCLFCSFILYWILTVVYSTRRPSWLFLSVLCWVQSIKAISWILNCIISTSETILNFKFLVHYFLMLKNGKLLLLKWIFSYCCKFIQSWCKLQKISIV